MRWFVALLLILPSAAAEPWRLSDEPLGDHLALGLEGSDRIVLRADATGDVIAVWVGPPQDVQQRFSDDATLSLVTAQGSSAGRIALVLTMDPGGNMSAIGSEQHLGLPGTRDPELFTFPVQDELVPAGHRVALMIRFIQPSGLVVDGASSALELPLVDRLSEAAGPSAPLAGPQGTDPPGASGVAVTTPVPTSDSPAWPWVAGAVTLLAGAVVLYWFLRQRLAGEAWEQAALAEEVREAQPHPSSQRVVVSTAERLERANAKEVQRPSADLGLALATDELADVVPAKMASGIKRRKLHYDPERCIGVTTRGDRCRRKPIEDEAACSTHIDQIAAGSNTAAKRGGKRVTGPWAH